MKRRTLALLSGLVWCGVILWLAHDIPVGMQIGEGFSVGAAAMESRVGGKCVSSEPQKIQTGYVGFRVPVSAETFRIRLYSDNGEVAFPLNSIRFFGVPLLTMRNITHFQMEEPLYSSVPSEDEPLRIKCRSGSILNLPNVFPTAMRLIRIFVLITAVFPVGVLILLCLCHDIGFLLLRQMDRVLSRPTVFGSLVLVCTLLLLPPPVHPASPGLDESWQWVLNRFAFTGSIGRDFVFTYGPLGFLICPQHTLSNVLAGIAVNIAYMATAALALWQVFCQARTLSGRCSVYLMLLVWVMPWPNGMEWRWCAVAVAILSLAAFAKGIEARTRNVLFVIAALLAVVQSFVKFSNCMSVIAQQLMLMIFFVFRNRCTAWSGTVAYASALFLSFLLGAFLLFPTMSAFTSWILGSLEIAKGYNLYMALERPMTDYFLPIAVVVMVACVWAALRRDKMARGFVWISLAPLLFCAYKYAVIRQGVEPLLLLLAWLSALFVSLEARFRRDGLFVSFGCFLLFFGSHSLSTRQVTWPDFSLDHLCQTLTPANALRNVRVVEWKQTVVARLPQSMLEIVGTNDVMVIGRDYGAAMAGDFCVQPFPAMQDYSAYTVYLEDLCIRRLADPEHPVRFLLAPSTPESIDYRNICLDNLRMWEFIRAHYEVADVSADSILLRFREPQNLNEQDQNAKDVLSIRYGAGDRVLGLIFRVPRRMARICYNDGSVCVYSANPMTLNGVVLPKHLPRNRNELLAFLSSSADVLPTVKSIDFICLGL